MVSPYKYQMHVSWFLFISNKWTWKGFSFFINTKCTCHGFIRKKNIYWQDVGGTPSNILIMLNDIILAPGNEIMLQNVSLWNLLSVYNYFPCFKIRLLFSRMEFKCMLWKFSPLRFYMIEILFGKLLAKWNVPLN